MLTFLRYIFLFLPLIFTACGKNEFTLEFELASDVTNNFNVTYYATDVKGGVTVQAVASVRDGKCVLNGMTKRPTLIYVTLRSGTIPLVMYGDRGEKIEITGENNNPLEWNVTGNLINDELSEWRKDNIKALSEANVDSINAGVKRFVEKNEENPVSAILILCYFKRDIDERGYSLLMSSLKGEARNSHWLEVVGRSDQIYHSYSYPARLQSLVMRSIKNGSDTLETDNKNPIILFFWQNGYTEKKDIIDSIKNIRKEYPDSVRIIADFCLDIDSIAWRQAVRRDSLDDVKRFWVPEGLVDPTIMKLKVNALPYFIVFDKEGNQSYRGKNLADAISSYRSLLKSERSL